VGLGTWKKEFVGLVEEAAGLSFEIDLSFEV
jgi:hypothetical protein